MATVFRHIVANTGTNMAGIGYQAYLAVHSWITAWGAFATPTNPGDSRRITGDHTFDTPSASTDGVLKFPFTPFSNEEMFEGQGGIGGKSAKGTISGFFAGRTLQMDEFVSNENFYTLWVRDANCASSVYSQHGTECLPAVLASWKYSSRKAGATEVKGYDLTFECQQSGPLQYEGELPIAVFS